MFLSQTFFDNLIAIRDGSHDSQKDSNDLNSDAHTGDITMANTFYPTNDAEFAIWLSNFTAKSDVHQATLGLDAADVTILRDGLNDFNSQLNTKQQKKEEAIAQTELVRVERRKLNKTVGLLNNKFKSIDGLATNIIEELGLNVDDDILTKTMPNVPRDLVVTGTSNGINYLKWSRAGNRQGTLFVIEAKIADSNEWTMINAVTSSKFKHSNQSPGVKIQYRVKAKRGDLESNYSNGANVYA